MSTDAVSREVSYDRLMETPLRVPFTAVGKVHVPMSEIWSVQFPKTYCHAICNGPSLPSVMVLGNPPIGVDARPIPYRSYLDPFAEQARGTIRHLPIYAKYGPAKTIFQNRLPVILDKAVHSEGGWDYGLVPCLFTLPGTYNLPMGFLPPRQDGSLKVFLAPLQLDAEGAAVLEGLWSSIQQELKNQDPDFFGSPGVVFQPILTESRPPTSAVEGGKCAPVSPPLRKFKYATVATAPLNVKEGERDPVAGSVFLDTQARESIRGSTASNTLGPGFVNGVTMGTFPLALENHRRCWPHTRMQTPVFLAEGLTSYFNKSTEKLEIRIKLLLVGGKVHPDARIARVEDATPHLIGVRNPFTQAQEAIAKTAAALVPVVDTATQGAEYLRAPLVPRSSDWVAQRLFRQAATVESSSMSASAAAAELTQEQLEPAAAAAATD